MTPCLKRGLVGAGIALACAGCDAKWQSTLAPRGEQAEHIWRLMLVFAVVCAVVWILVMAALLASLFKRSRTMGAPDAADASSEKRSAFVVSAAVAATVLIITGLAALSFFTTRSLTAAASDALVLRVRGYQWWWEVTYLDARPDRIFTTANEIHLPVGRPVRIELQAPDVIHSFWVPSLAGKQDMIPGRDNEIKIEAERVGVYRGQCAQFCGLQHAHMALLVIAEPPAEFEAWRAAQLRPRSAPSNEEEKTGEQVFLAKPCASCHTIQGVPASGTLGPDLTHVGSRRTIAAGLLPLSRGSLAAWIADPQTIKPGNNMPMTPLSGDELRAVSAYTASLK
jgi:cytochrome c oxidase subunit II